MAEPTAADKVAADEAAAEASALFDPSEKTVEEVQEYLLTADKPEVERVKAAEAEGKARKGILEAKRKQRVKYTGASDVREISEEAWASLGLKQGTVRFDSTNNWSIPASDFGTDVLEYFDTRDEGFTLVDVD